jgi:hypothetical protein
MKKLFVDRKFNTLVSTYNLFLENSVKRLTRSDFEKSTMEELAKKLNKDLEITVPELTKDDIYTKQPKDISIASEGSRTPNVEGTEFIFIIPFNGDSSFFEIIPSKFLRIPPYGNAENNKITISYKVPNGRDSSGLRNEFDKNLDNIETHLAFLDNDFKLFNDKLPDAIKNSLEQRKAKFDADDETASGFGFPVK